MIPLPPPDAVLYSARQGFAARTTEQVAAGKTFLGAVSGAPASDSLFEEVADGGAARAGMESRRGADARRAFSGAKPRRANRGRASRRRAHSQPDGAGDIARGRRVLALGAPSHLAEFKLWLRARADEVEDVKAD